MSDVQQLRSLCQHPQLTADQKTQLDGAIRKIENLRDSEHGKSISPAFWQMLIAAAVEIVKIFLGGLTPTPGPAPAQTTGGQPAQGQQPQRAPGTKK